jgi:hypothetical protein
MASATATTNSAVLAKILRKIAKIEGLLCSFTLGPPEILN